MRWHVVQVKSNADQVAEKALIAEDYTVYFPKVQVTVSHARRRIKVVRPFLTGYGFLLDEGRSLHYAKTARGVAGIVMQGEQPAFLRNGVIEAIRSREDDKGFVKLLIDDPKFDQLVPGRPVRVASGLMAGAEGVFLERDGKRRAMLFLGAVKVSVAVETLEPV